MATPRKFYVYLRLMKVHHTKTKGDLGVLKAQADLCEKGYLVCVPMSEHAPFDLIAYRESEFKRVQVKARSLEKGRLNVRFEHSYSDSRGVHVRKIDFREVDVYCVYCLDNQTCYYFKSADFTRYSTISLRVEKPRNNQSRHVRWANDFLKVP